MSDLKWREHASSGRRRLGSRLRAGFTALLLAAGCLTAIVVSTLAVAPAAMAGTAPAPPAGWSTVSRPPRAVRRSRLASCMISRWLSTR